MVYTNYYIFNHQPVSSIRQGHPLGERVQKVQVSDRLVESMATLVQGEPWTQVLGEGRNFHQSFWVNGLVGWKWIFIVDFPIKNSDFP